MTIYLSNRDGDGKTNEEGHYKFQTSVFLGNILGQDSLKVIQNSPLGMSVIISPGQFKIDTSSNYSYTGWNSSDYILPISTSDAANPRITSIIVYVDKQETTSPSPPNNPGIVKFIAVNGAPSATPTAPNDTTIQGIIGANNPYIILANITVPASSSQIINSNIIDTRSQVTVGSNLIDTDSIIDSAVTTPKIANLAVTNDKLANNSITANKLANGIVDDSKWRNNVAFYSKLTVTKNITASTFTKFACNSIEYNLGGGYSNSSNIGRFTAPVTGAYLFYARLSTRTATTTRTIIELRKNGSTNHSRASDQTSSNNTVINATIGYNLNAGDYVEAWAWASANVNIASGAGQAEMGTDFGGHLITRF